MSAPPPYSPHETRPPCMILLGLQPPYVLDDIKTAYREKAKLLHPDRGGTVAEFEALHVAFEEAQQFLRFRQDRRSWIAHELENYLELQTIEAQLKAWGATVELQTTDWLQKSFGDFAQLTETITRIELRHSPHGPELLKLLQQHASRLVGLNALQLVDCQIDDPAAQNLASITALQILDLSSNPVTNALEQVLEKLPHLQQLRLKNTRVSCFANYRIQRRIRSRSQQQTLVPRR